MAGGFAMDVSAATMSAVAAGPTGNCPPAPILANRLLLRLAGPGDRLGNEEVPGGLFGEVLVAQGLGPGLR